MRLGSHERKEIPIKIIKIITGAGRVSSIHSGKASLHKPPAWCVKKEILDSDHNQKLDQHKNNGIKSSGNNCL